MASSYPTRKMNSIIQEKISLDRLVLRPFRLDDAKEVQRMAGNIEVAKRTLNMPYPYEDGVAEEWINSHEKARLEGTELNWAISLKPDLLLIGSVGLLHISHRHRNGELGYWIGKSYWNNGYCTEAAGGIIHHSFEALKFKKVFSIHFASNPASGKVMTKNGMVYEGTLRQHVERFGQLEDLKCFGILRNEWESK